MERENLDELSTRLFFRLAAQQDAIMAKNNPSDLHISVLPKIAANHLAGSLAVAARANSSGLHAIALSLARQSFESMTIVELGLINTAESWQRLVAWDQGKVTAGSLRKWLSLSTWTAYKPDLLGKPWCTFMERLGKALQPYAHFSSELLQWNLSVVPIKADGTPKLVSIGPGSFDQNKAIRLQVLRAVLLWSVGRVMEQHAPTDQEAGSIQREINPLQVELLHSDWLVGGDDWALNLIPHVWTAV